MMAIELVRDREDKDPGLRRDEEARPDLLQERTRPHFRRQLRKRDPDPDALVITDEQFDRGFDILASGMEELSAY